MRKKRSINRRIGMVLATSILASLASCGNQEKPQESTTTQAEETTTVESVPEQTESTPIYSITEENLSPELTMSRQPEASYWFPAQLLEWNKEEDPDLIFNISTVPLAERVDTAKLETVNETQNRDTKVMSISIMNGSTSGNSPHGLNKVDANAFTYWQYVDLLVYWGGSSGEGLIVAPSADVVDAGHKNGVKVIGTVFMPQAAHGGKMEWLEDLLKKA